MQSLLWHTLLAIFFTSSTENFKKNTDRVKFLKDYYFIVFYQVIVKKIRVYTKINCYQIHISKFYIFYFIFHVHFMRWSNDYPYDGLAKEKKTEDRKSLSRVDIDFYLVKEQYAKVLFQRTFLDFQWDVCGALRDLVPFVQF